MLVKLTKKVGTASYVIATTTTILSLYTGKIKHHTYNHFLRPEKFLNNQILGKGIALFILKGKIRKEWDVEASFH
jgi:hypothetical protein